MCFREGRSSCPNEPKTAGKLFPYGAKSRENLELEKESVVVISAGANPVKVEQVSASRVGDTLAKEDRLVPGKLK